MNSSSDSAPLRRLVYALLITIVLGAVAGRILAVARLNEPHLSRLPEEPEDGSRGLWPKSRPEPMPTLGDNDRSRWDTIRALVDNGTYAIGHRDREHDPATGKPLDSGIITEDGWKTIDKVKNPDTQDFYSSKPPLLPTIVAGEYWLMKHIFGWSITADRWVVVRIILLTVNWLPFMLYLVLLARLVEQLGSSDWGRIFVLAAGCFATLMIPFQITLNNHTVAACSALFALYPALQILRREKKEEAANAGSISSSGPPSLRPSVPPSYFILAGFFAAFTACNELPAASFAVALYLLLLWREPGRTLAYFTPAAAIPVAAFFLTNYLAIGQLKPAYTEFGGPWYEYEGSFWKTEPGQIRQGIDFAPQKESKATYAFHVLIGHHGWFSLTPIWLLSLGGMFYSLVRWAKPQAMLAGLTLPVSAVVLCFYILYVDSRNYGGWTSGLRWLIWLTPLWLLTMIPLTDRLATRRWCRGLCYVLLAVSVFSASYPAWNPWRQPWLYNLMETQGWVKY